MISTTNLSLVPGAELIEHNGERGMFIPMSSLMAREYYGKLTYSIVCGITPYRLKKNSKPGAAHIVAHGRLMFPEWAKDKRLEDPAYIAKDPVVQWILNPPFNLRGVEYVMDDSEFKDILNR